MSTAQGSCTSTSSGYPRYAFSKFSAIVFHIVKILGHWLLKNSPQGHCDILILPLTKIPAPFDISQVIILIFYEGLCKQIVLYCICTVPRTKTCFFCIERFLFVCLPVWLCQWLDSYILSAHIICICIRTYMYKHKICAIVLQTLNLEQILWVSIPLLWREGRCFVLIHDYIALYMNRYVAHKCILICAMCMYVYACIHTHTGTHSVRLYVHTYPTLLIYLYLL